MDEVKGNIYLVTERNTGLVYQTSTRLAFYPRNILNLQLSLEAYSVQLRLWEDSDLKTLLLSAPSRKQHRESGELQNKEPFKQPLFGLRWKFCRQ